MFKMVKEKKQTKVSNKEVQQPKMKSPIDLFFKLGDWATGGDPIKVQDFQYYMLAILFLAFTSMFFLNIYRFFTTWDSSFLIWGLIGFAIASLQYFNLKNFYMMRKARKEAGNQKPTTHEEEHKIEDVDEMLKEFSNKNEQQTKTTEKPSKTD